MKKNASAIIMSVFLPFCFLIGLVACEKNMEEKPRIENVLTPKEGQNKTSKIFKARLLASFCAYNIVQIQDSTFYNYGMDWTDSQGNAYQHVFSVRNHCDFGAANLKVNETFDCKIVEKAIVEDCVVCLGFMETPPFLHNIYIVK